MSPVNPNSKSRLFRQLAQQLRDSCRHRGLTLPDGAAEQILADRIADVAKLLRVTERHAMATYLTDEALDQIVDLCVQAKTERDTEVELASPMLLPIAHAARIIAGLGMAVTAATTSADHSTATTAIREAADTLTHIALAVSRAGDTGHALIEPSTAVAARAELTRFADHLAEGTWTIPDEHDDLADSAERNQRLHAAVLHDIGYLQ
jgi:hypothetical protein